MKELLEWLAALVWVILPNEYATPLAVYNLQILLCLH